LFYHSKYWIFVTVLSMTGYARVDGSVAIDRLGQTWTWGWELKSVNARGLDLRCRVPSGSERLDTEARKVLAGRLTRGSVSAQLSIQCAELATRAPRINRTFLDDIMVLQEQLETEGSVFPSPPRLDVLLNIRGMIDESEALTLDNDERVALEGAAMIGLATALAELVTMRAEEGRRLHSVLGDQLTNLEGLLCQAREVTAGQPDTLQERLRAQLNEILQASPPISEERLAQELAIIVTKADVGEEIERLAAHLDACQDLMASGEPVGRRLDFLCQELNREANTICSKSANLTLSGVGLEMKSVIEQFREQIQNVE
jgi:uncharacterized protein (TIGR00255 family)